MMMCSDWRGYLSEESVKAAVAHWGRNEFELSIPSFWDLYYQQLLSPMFIFQVH